MNDKDQLIDSINDLIISLNQKEDLSSYEKALYTQIIKIINKNSFN